MTDGGGTLWRSTSFSMMGLAGAVDSMRTDVNR
eukprot:CAMPEP_0201999072 /NCGR_PEP_ID=MMETSP0905-20130828/5735_1 /ASSEMBLY_ACC=CAM_ASM_000554 /TAXON_ID=420261 /ORGANISM="Thalassiosira antarctica, Strain CCMP982" /LENGTH=32 /DNA_ID= /DNA_START= /DNA_END= /DNA_ORIENTATION=